MSDENFLSRWSRRKTESKVGTANPVEEVPAQPTPEAQPVGLPADLARAEPAPVITKPEAQALPPVESLTPESDFSPFMKAEVDPGVKRQAFKKLIEDPRYNVMDGLDVYIDDYSKEDPLPAGWLEKMNQVKHLGIFRQPEEGAEAQALAETIPEAAPLQKSIVEQPLAEGDAGIPVDTSAPEIPPFEVGKAGGRGGGS